MDGSTAECTTAGGQGAEQVTGPGDVPAERPGRRWRGLLAHRDFMLLWGGFTVSSLGTALSNLAVPILALAISGSPTLAGLVGAARYAPYLLLNALAGVLVDRWDRRLVMIVADLGRFAVLATVPLAYALDGLTVTHLALVAFLEGAGHVFSAVSHLSALPRLVPAEQVPSANAANEVGDSAASVGGSALFGVLVGAARNSTLGAVYAYAVDALTYLASGVSLLFVRGPLQGEREGSGRTSILDELKEGFAFLWRRRLLRLLMLLITAVNFLQAPLTLAAIVLATEQMGVGAGLIGLTMAGVGAATVLSGLAASRLTERIGLRALVLGSVLLWAVAAAVMALAPGPMPLATGVLITSVLWPVFAVAVVSYRLTATPDALQGRVNSAFRTLSFGAEPLGLALGGTLIAAAGSRAVFWGAAAGLALVLLGGAWAWRRLSAAGEAASG
ncbi:MFS transporter [Streptomyces sp. NPDC127084]|uniref:MFS transporter n=1 Tax=Streptomyces sp. NPDC127084 TaxID=3347133 RepID=UPI00365CBD01